MIDPRYCGRCGKDITKQKEHIRIGDYKVEETLIEICCKCQGVWHNVYIKRLDEAKLNGEEWHKMWKELYFEFFRDGKAREQVIFT